MKRDVDERPLLALLRMVDKDSVASAMCSLTAAIDRNVKAQAASTASVSEVQARLERVESQLKEVQRRVRTVALADEATRRRARRTLSPEQPTAVTVYCPVQQAEIELDFDSSGNSGTWNCDCGMTIDVSNGEPTHEETLRYDCPLGTREGEFVPAIVGEYTCKGCRLTVMVKPGRSGFTAHHDIESSRVKSGHPPLLEYACPEKGTSAYVHARAYEGKCLECKLEVSVSERGRRLVVAHQLLVS